ncbi:hypothetical protein JOD01_003931 [Brevibacillus fulvus]|uniref:C2H2-type domain-containing protein n=1 Tax=Brevibacillus fulvus TaxID=1125967 RepID=A0A938Y1L6_9BACL|nr:hypothetical protein [Brevibacillus fulvus]
MYCCPNCLKTFEETTTLFDHLSSCKDDSEMKKILWGGQSHGTKAFQFVSEAEQESEPVEQS